MVQVSAISASHEARLSVVENAVVRIENAVDKIADALTILTKIDAKHEAAAADIADNASYTRNVDARLQEIEKVIPQLMEVRGWIVRGVVAVIGMVGVALVGLVIVTRTEPHPQFVPVPPAVIAVK